MTFMKAFKKLIKYTAILSATAALSLVFMAGCSSGMAKRPSSPNDMGVVVEPPKTGSPIDYDALKNIEFIKGKLASCEYYHIESESNVTATALNIPVEQNVLGSKNYADGILITETVSTSNSNLAPSKAIQRYFGEEEVFVRSPATEDSGEWQLGMEWSDEAPQVLNGEEYEAAYGLRANELSDFVLSKETIVSAEELQKDGENFVLTLSLDTEKAPAYYINQMITMGGLSKVEFTKLELTIVFDSEWTVLSMHTVEEYKSYKKVLFEIEASCAGGSVITYSYDKEGVDISAYEDYFRQYEKSAD